jgi:hypothetical protein
MAKPEALAKLMPSITDCDVIPTVGFTFSGYFEGETQSENLNMIAAILDSDDKQDMTKPSLYIPPADFSQNPVFNGQIDGELYIVVNDVEMTITELNIQGEFTKKLNSFQKGILEGTMNPEPFSDELGVNICLLEEVCNPEGNIELRIEYLVGEYIPGLVIVEHNIENP